jgi:DNA-binding NarL/FixJ family response regulator
VTLRIVLAEDNALLREGIRGLLSGVDGLEVAAVCVDLDTLLAALDEHVPDVVLSDIRMPPTRTDEGVRAAAYARKAHPRMGFVLLSQYADPALVRALLAQGAEGRGYLLKERVSDVDELVTAVRTVAAGGSVMDPKVVESLVRTRTRSADSEIGRLTAREREVLEEMARGRNNAAIAGSLVITQRAVEKHINSIFSKLGVGMEDETHPRVRAVLKYLAGEAS